MTHHNLIIRRIVSALFALLLCCSLSTAGQLSLLQAGGIAAASGCSTTWSPTLIGANLALSNGNNTVTQNTNAFDSVLSNNNFAGTERYVEVNITSGAVPATTSVGVGISNASPALSTYLGQDPNSINYYVTGSVFYNNNSGTYVGASQWTNGAVIGIAYNTTGNKLCLTLDGTNWNTASGNTSCPTSGGGAFTPAITGPFYIGATENDNGGTVSITLNACGPFAYTMPSGYSHF